MILLIDSYDSFSYNLYQLVGEVNPDIRVIRSDEMTVDEIRSLGPERIILSPGPGRPEEAGVIMDVARDLGKEIPILGVCLGHQAICGAFGGKITYARKLMHGKQSLVRLDSSSRIFCGCPERTPVARYHSLAAEPESLPDCLKVIASTDEGEIMAVEHREYPVFGLQFHPESIMTPKGKRMIRNFLQNI